MHAFAALLEREGVRPGDRVGLQSENRPEWGIAYLAILEAGAVVVPLDAQLKAQEVGEILATAGATHVVVSARQLPGARRRCASRDCPRCAFVTLDADRGAAASWDEALRAYPDAAPRELAGAIRTTSPCSSSPRARPGRRRA